MKLEEDFEEFESAEDFLHFFEIDYEPGIVQVNRLHILQRFHDYLKQAEDALPEDGIAQREIFRELLKRAYQDFVESDAQTEKVFKVFKMAEPQSVFISLNDIQT